VPGYYHSVPPGQNTLASLKLTHMWANSKARRLKTSRRRALTSGRALLLLADRTANDLLRLLDDGGKMVGALKAFGVELIDLFRARGASSEPAAH
jgi:hypothetical protein